MDGCCNCSELRKSCQCCVWFMSNGVTECPVVSHREMRGLACNGGEHCGLRSVDHIGCEECEAKAAVTAGVRHHSSRMSGKFEGVGDDIKAEVGDTILKDTVDALILCNKLWAREESDQDEGAVG